jgi:hypothetical protein
MVVSAGTQGATQPCAQRSADACRVSISLQTRHSCSPCLLCLRSLFRAFFRSHEAQPAERGHAADDVRRRLGRTGGAGESCACARVRVVRSCAWRRLARATPRARACELRAASKLGRALSARLARTRWLTPHALCMRAHVPSHSPLLMRPAHALRAAVRPGAAHVARDVLHGEGAVPAGHGDAVAGELPHRIAHAMVPSTATQSLTYQTRRI